MTVWILEYVDDELLAFQIDSVYSTYEKAEQAARTLFEGPEWTRVREWKVR